MIGLMRELRTTMALPIFDTILQRGLTMQEIADLAGMDVVRIRMLVEQRDLKSFKIDDLDEILDALEWSEPRMKP